MASAVHYPTSAFSAKMQRSALLIRSEEDRFVHPNRAEGYTCVICATTPVADARVFACCGNGACGGCSRQMSTCPTCNHSPLVTVANRHFHNLLATEQFTCKYMACAWQGVYKDAATHVHQVDDELQHLKIENMERQEAHAQDIADHAQAIAVLAAENVELRTTIAVVLAAEEAAAKAVVVALKAEHKAELYAASVIRNAELCDAKADGIIMHEALREMAEESAKTKEEYATLRERHAYMEAESANIKAELIARRTESAMYQTLHANGPHSHGTVEQGVSQEAHCRIYPCDHPWAESSTPRSRARSRS